MTYATEQDQADHQAKVLRAVAELVAGVQVPVSIMGPELALGAGADGWHLLRGLAPYGWFDADNIEAALNEVFA